MARKPLNNAVPMTLLVAGLLMTVAANGQDLLIDESFEFDIAGWNYFGGPEVILRWDGDSGMPDPGSLQLSSTVALGEENPLFEAMSECLPVSAGETFQVEAMVLANPRYGDNCFVSVVFFEGPNCSGPRSFSGNVSPNTPGVWEPRSAVVTVGSGSQSARVSFSLFLSPPAGLATCNFDSVSLARSPQHGAPVPEDIPTLAAAGLLALFLATACGAVVALRRCRPAA